MEAVLDPEQLSLLRELLSTDHTPPKGTIIERRAMGGNDAAPLPEIANYGGKTAAAFDAASRFMGKDDMDKFMAYAQAPPTADNRSFGWKRRLLDCVKAWTNYFRKFHPDVPADEYWVADTVDKHAIPYLVMRTVTTKGVDGPKIKARSLISWSDGLINAILQYTHKSSTDRKYAGSYLVGERQLVFRIHAKVQESSDSSYEVIQEDAAIMKRYNARKDARKDRIESEGMEDHMEMRIEATIQSLKDMGTEDAVLSEFRESAGGWVREIKDATATCPAATDEDRGEGVVDLDLDLDKIIITCLLPSVP
ncbi:hypothetical protein AURDEDRAFT_165293 [Auricularia subglabra TFB-10046 SS5]|nr:hypothetical protein AURDEDRAFT_165293 [Auricularia subglabra TFB-10046 SS5]